MSTEASLRLSAELAGSLEVCWRKAAAPAEWRLTLDQFAPALEKSITHRFADKQPTPTEIEVYLATLHLPDMALAIACSAGNEPAWEFFVAQYRPELYRAARAIAGDSRGRELADSLYADLYGLRESGGSRNSLFDYFRGRSKLGTWLRAVLSRRHIDEIRRAQRTDPLEHDRAGEHLEPARAPHPEKENHVHDPDRAKSLAILQAALTAALAGLESRDRLRLAYYYVDDLTLAQIGRLLAEHEATVSRKLERTRQAVKKRVERALRVEKKLSEAQWSLCLEYAREQWPFDLTRVLSDRP